MAEASSNMVGTKRWHSILIGCLAWVGALVFFFPVFWMVLSSFKQPNQIFETPPSLLFQPTLDNYRALWSQHQEFFRGLLSSLYVTIGTSLLVVVASTCSGYVYARFSNPALNLSAFGLLAVRMLPPIIITLPLFPVVNALKLLP